MPNFPEGGDAVRIRLYNLLRDAAQRRSLVEMEVAPGDTVGSVLERLITQYPRMRPLLFARPGVLLPYVIIVKNGRDVRDSKGLEEPVGPEDELALFPPSAGG